MKFNYIYLFILLFVFIILFYIFYAYYKLNLKEFIPNRLYNIYIYSTIICILLFLFFVYYILIKNDFIQITITKIFTSILCMMLGFGLWIISNYYKNKLFSIICVLFISISNLYLLYIVSYIDEYKNNYKLLKQISLVSIFYLLFHHIVIDLILWNIM